MNLKEFEGKELFEKYGISVPRAIIAEEPGEAYKKAFLLFGKASTGPGSGKLFLKAQLKSGKRGKSGAILECKLSELKKTFSSLLGKNFGGEQVRQIMIAEKIGIKKEFYLSISVDRYRRCPVLLFSDAGGENVEEQIKANPKKGHKLYLSINSAFPEDRLQKLFNSAGCNQREAKETVKIANKLFLLFKNEDASLAEINPLILNPEGKFYAVDAKVVIDQEAIFRHPELEKRVTDGMSFLEKRAGKFGLAYVELDGDVGIIGNGAGLVMSSLDMIEVKGFRPANFCDVGGGASALMMEEALQLIRTRKNLRGLFINIFGGITRCDEIAEGLVSYVKKNKFNYPLLVRLTGTNAKQALKILKSAGIKAHESFNEAIRHSSNFKNET